MKKIFKNKKYLIFDFDGVIYSSNNARIQSYRELFINHPKEKIEELLFFIKNEGLISRYELTRHFFTNILKKTITQKKIRDCANCYSIIVYNKILRSRPVPGAINFIRKNYKKYALAIISSSDQEELRAVCQKKRISKYFFEILGSPVKKEKNIADLLKKYKMPKKDCLYIGDSKSDYYAARKNKISFLGIDSGLCNWSAFSKNIVHLKNFQE